MSNYLRFTLFLFIFFTIQVVGSNFNYISICIKNAKSQQQCFDSRIVDTPILRAKGLMGEISLPMNEGMLFVFPKEMKPGFWMKNMKVPIDIIFINDQDAIVYMVKNAQPCVNSTVNTTDDCPVYTTTRFSSKVLEINAGLSNKYNFHVGDKIEYFIED